MFFGTLLCGHVPLPFCFDVLEKPTNRLCLARNIELGVFPLFQPGTVLLLFIALGLLFAIIGFIRRKYTAIGRLEMAFFFHLYALVLLLEILLYSNLVPVYTLFHLYISNIHLSTVTTMHWALLFNGFVGFQILIDGTPSSMWLLRGSSLLIFGLCFGTFFLAQSNQVFFSTFLLVILSLNGLFLLVYLISQCFLVFFLVEDKRPLFVLFVAFFFFVLAGFSLGFSNLVCFWLKHYMDGLFFSTLFFLLAVMMVYKYWDSITGEAFEFFVDQDQNTWSLQEQDAQQEVFLVKNKIP